MKHLLITGANGQLGQSFAAIAKQWPQFTFTFADKKLADITNQLQMAALILKLKPYAVINCAAFTNVDIAEQQPELAYAVNATAVKQLAQLCVDTNILLVHFSTDYVFSGNKQQAYIESDIAEPINVYGASKLAGEQAMLNIAPPGLILRSSWLYSEFGHNFVRSIFNKIQQGQSLEIEQPLQVVADQIGSPTYAPELAALCLKLLSAKNFAKHFATTQLLHCAGQGETSWYHIAEQILNSVKQQAIQNKTQQTTITAISSKQWQSAATRPAYSALSSMELQQKFGLSLPPWQQSLTLAVTGLLRKR